MKKVLTFILVILFVLLLVLLVKTYLDINTSKKYVEFATDSTNDTLVKVEEMNKSLNEFSYDEDSEENDTSTLESKLADTKSSVENIEKELESYKKPYKSESVENEFKLFLEKSKSAIEAFEALLETIDNLEDQEEYRSKLEDYIGTSNDLQMQAENLENALNEFVDNNTKFDFERIIDAVKYI